MDKDYYRVLGVLDDAEDIVIKAAYKALAQRYHPDKWTGSKEEATRRMADINEAYSVLSDPVKRKQYDDLRDQSAYKEEDDSDDLTSSIEQDWQVVTEYFPDLVDITRRLRQVSRTLASSFKLVILETKDFDNRQQVAEKLERAFFEKYFGSNDKVRQFAKKLFQAKRYDVVKELNSAVVILGATVDANTVISKLKIKHSLHSLETADKIMLAQRVVEKKDINTCMKFVAKMGGKTKTFTPLIFGVTKYIVYRNGAYKEYRLNEYISFVVALANEFLSREASK